MRAKRKQDTPSAETFMLARRYRLLPMQSFELHPVPPFRLELTVWALRRLSINATDRWDGNAYRRVHVVGDEAVEVSVEQTGPPTSPVLRVSCSNGRIGEEHEKTLLATLNNILGTKVDLSDFYRIAGQDRLLESLVMPFVGLKPPRFPSVFEAIVNGIACQQLSLTVGITLLNRLAVGYGIPCLSSRAFPRPKDFIHANPEDLKKLGFSTRKSEYILVLSRAIEERRIDLNVLHTMEDNSAVALLKALPGVGRWTAQYVALRGLGRLDVFPADDVGGQNKLQGWLNLSGRPDYEAVNRILEKWAPYRGLIYFHLLLSSIARKELLGKP